MHPTYHSQSMQWLLRAPLIVAGASFTIGTALLLYFLSDPHFEPIMPIGFCFVVLAFFVNSVVFTSLIICGFILKEYQKEIFTRAGLLLVNIPIAAVYIYIVFNSDPFVL